MRTPLTQTQSTALRGLTVSVTVLLALLALTLLATGCNMPQWRVFQTKIDPKVTEKSTATVEAERRSAALIADLSATPTSNPAGRIAEIHAVAVPLSASLGEPLKRATVFEAPAVIAASQAGIRDAQRKADQWKAFARKYADQPIEGTGFNLAGPAGLLALVGVIAACIAFPALGYLLLRVVPLLWGFFKSATAGVAEFVEANPEAGERLKANLSRKMDLAHKRMVRRHRQ